MKCKPEDRYKKKNINKTVKFGGGSLNFWACINYEGPGPLYKINGNLDGK